MKFLFVSLSIVLSLQSWSAPLDWSSQGPELPKQFSLLQILDKNPNLYISHDLSDEDEMNDFVESIAFYGLLTVGERTLLLTRHPKALRDFTQNAALNGKAFDGVQPEPIQVDEFPEHKAYDLTKAKYMTPLIHKIGGTRAWDEGPNCWNLCQLSKGWARTTYSTDENEFSLLMNSPFTKIVTTTNFFGLEPKQGDFIVLRQRGYKTGTVKEVHCAVSLGFDLAFTKNGASFEAPYQVMRVSDMLSVYLPSLSNSVEHLQVPPFDEVWTKWKDAVSPELKSLVERWMSFEARHARTYFPTKNKDEEMDQDETRALDDIKRALQKEINNTADKKLQPFENHELSELESVEKFFWMLLKERAKASYF